MKTYFPKIRVEPAGGKDNIQGMIYKFKDQRLFVFYDALSSGFLEDGIRRMARACKVEAVLFRPLSFEKYLLDSPFLKGCVNGDVKIPIDDLEDYYARVLATNLPHGYTKGNLPSCIKKDCAVAVREGYQYCPLCRLQNFKSSKRDLVVYGVLSKLKGV